MITKKHSLFMLSAIMKMGLQSFASLLTRCVFGFLVLFAMLVSFTTKVYSQTDWTKCEANPVLEVGPAGSWDDAFLGSSSVLIEGTTYHMWYVGDDGTYSRIGHATSADGITWTKDTLNPVLDLGPAGSWNDDKVYFPSVVFDGAMFHMWFSGHDGASWDGIGYATSPDGSAWTKYFNNPIFVGSAREWDGTAGGPTVLIEGTTYHMWYHGADDVSQQIGHATSSDGIIWTKDTHNPVLDAGSAGSWDRPRVQNPRVSFDGTDYHMWYAGGGLFTWRIGYAKSPDGVTWTKDTHNPVLNVGSAGSWDDYYVAHPSVVFDTATSTYKMWYMGGFKAWQGNIGYATDSTTTGIDDNISTDLPRRFSLSQNYPNPFNPSTRISYSIPTSGIITLKIYDMLGREIQTLVSDIQKSGTYSINFDGSGLSSGIYFYRLQVGSDLIKTRKMLLIR